MKKINLQKWIIKNAISLFLAFSVLFVIGCEDDGTNNPYENDVHYSGDASGQPVVNSISPESAIAGVTEVTISGNNFSETDERLLVYFGGAKAEILSTSKTQIKVKVPNLIGDQLDVRVGTDHELWSEIVHYDLKPAYTLPNEFSDDEEVFSVAVNSSEEIFISMKAFNAGVGVKRFFEGNKPVEFAPKGGETFWNDLKFAKDDTLVGARNVFALFNILEGQIPTKPFVKFGKSSNKIVAFDYDANDVIWAGGSGGKLFSATSDGTVTEFEYKNDIIALKVFDGYLYAITDNLFDEWAVKRFKINSSTELGPEEMYFNFSQEFGYIQKHKWKKLYSLTFSQDGDMYLGTYLDDAILVVYTDGTYESLYPDILKLNPNFGNYVRSMYWGNDQFLYVTYVYVYKIEEGEEYYNSSVMKINMQKLGAPQYGRD